MKTRSSKKFLEMAQRIIDRKPLPNDLSSEMLALLDQEIKNQSFFSAHVENMNFLQRARGILSDFSKGAVKQTPGGPAIKVGSREAFVSEMRQFMLGEGMATPDDFADETRGSVRDITSRSRLELIFETNIELERGRAMKLRSANDRVMMKALPAWELIRVAARNEPRDWPARFEQAGGTLIDGRMIAIKTDPVWAALGNPGMFGDAIGTDVPPFAWNSGMGWRDVSGTEWHQLTGADAPPQVTDDPTPAEPSASVANIDPDLRERALREIDDQLATLNARRRSMGDVVADIVRDRMEMHGF